MLIDGINNRTHNHLYVPKSVKKLKFDQWCKAISADDELKILLGDDELGKIMFDATDNKFLTQFLDIPLRLRKQTDTLAIQLFTGANVAAEAGVRIDNAAFVIPDPATCVWLILVGLTWQRRRCKSRVSPGELQLATIR